MVGEVLTDGVGVLVRRSEVAVSDRLEDRVGLVLRVDVDVVHPARQVDRVGHRQRDEERCRGGDGRRVRGRGGRPEVLVDQVEASAGGLRERRQARCVSGHGRDQGERVIHAVDRDETVGDLTCGEGVVLQHDRGGPTGIGRQVDGGELVDIEVDTLQRGARHRLLGAVVRLARRVVEELGDVQGDRGGRVDDRAWQRHGRRRGDEPEPCQGHGRKGSRCHSE